MSVQVIVKEISPRVVEVLVPGPQGPRSTPIASDVTVNPIAGLQGLQAQAVLEELQAEIAALVAGKLNASAYTAADVLTKLLTVDENDSGLNATTLGGLPASAFALADHPHEGLDGGGYDTPEAVLAALLTVDDDLSGLNASTLRGLAPSAFAGASHPHAASQITVTPAGGIEAANVQDALVELSTGKASTAQLSAKQDTLGFTPVPNTRTVNSQSLSSDITLTTANINDSTDKRYVTEAQSTTLGNTSGTNTGDQDLSGFYTKTESDSLLAGKQSSLGYTPVPNTRTVNSQALSSDITLTTAQVADSADKRYVTDEQLTALGNLGEGGGDLSSNTATSVDSELALFSGTTGKLIKRATETGIIKLSSGVIGVATAETDYLTPTGSAAGLTSFPTLNQNTTGTAANLSGTPALPNGTTTTTQAGNDNSQKLATTAYVDEAPLCPIMVNSSWLDVWYPTVTTTSNSFTLNNIVLVKLEVQKQITLSGVGIHINTAQSGGLFRLGIYDCVTPYDLSPANNLVVDAGEVSCSSTGFKPLTINVTLPKGYYWLATNCNNTAIATRTMVSTNYIGSQTGNNVLGGACIAYNYGAFPATFPAGAVTPLVNLPGIVIKRSA